MLKIKYLKLLLSFIFCFLTASVSSAKSASLNFKMETKSVSAAYKSKLANKLLLEKTNYREGRFDILNIRGNYNVLLFGLDTDKDKLIADFIENSFTPLKCGGIIQSSVPEDSSDIAEFDDLCVFPGSKLIFVNLKDGLPDSIEIRDLED